MSRKYDWEWIFQGGVDTEGDGYISASVSIGFGFLNTAEKPLGR